MVVWSGSESPELKQAVLQAGAVACFAKSDVTLLIATLRGMSRGRETSGVVRVSHVVESIDENASAPRERASKR